MNDDDHRHNSLVWMSKEKVKDIFKQSGASLRIVLWYKISSVYACYTLKLLV